jgi:hypothetical protein
MGESAIVVERRGELRLESGSYLKKARELGLVVHSGTSLAEHSVFDLEKREGKEERRKGNPLPPRGSPSKNSEEAILAIHPRSSPPSAVALLRRTGARGIPAFSRKRETKGRALLPGLLLDCRRT